MVSFAALLIAAAVAGCAPSEASAPSGDGTAASTPKPQPKIKVPSRLKALEYAPCGQCHQHVSSAKGERRVSPHSTIRVEHMDGGENCKTCHSAVSPDFLQLMTGKLVSIDNADQLCGQCHSAQTADWRLGIHGKQVGNWQKELHRYSCATCHNPHKPAFGSMLSVPPPPFPTLGVPKGAH